MNVIRKRLWEREGAPSNTRVNPETGIVETSMDGGATWVPDPYSDPRQNPAYLLPPPTAPDVKCAAAAGMVENVRRVIDGAAGGTTVAGIATLLLTLLLIPGIGWMFAAMLLFASVFVAATAAAVLAAFTEDVYDYLLCSFYANIDADGRVSWAQLEDVLADVGGHFPDPLVGEILGGIMQMHREVGFTNAGVVYADPDAECACEPEWCFVWDFTVDDGGWIGVSGSHWVDGQGWTGVDLDPDNRGWVYIHKEFDATNITQIGMYYCKPSGSGGNNSVGTVLNLETVTQYINFPLGEVGCPDNYFWDTDVVADQAYLNVNSSADLVTVYISSAVMRGTGVCPFGEPNC